VTLVGSDVTVAVTDELPEVDEPDVFLVVEELVPPLEELVPLLDEPSLADSSELVEDELDWVATSTPTMAPATAHSTTTPIMIRRLLIAMLPQLCGESPVHSSRI